VDSLLAWLSSVPIGTLYFALAGVAAIENVFPPVPADTVVALGSFLAARGRGNIWATFLATWSGNVASAMIMYAVGRKYGSQRLEKRLLGERGPQADRRLERLYGRYGVTALFASRFIPGVRAIVPPFAGALRVPPLRAGVAMALASAIWYGTVSYLAFTIGGNWQRVLQLITDYGRALALGAAAILLIGLVIWRTRNRKISQS